MSEKFAHVEALVTDATLAPFELKLEGGHGFLVITEALENEVVVEGNEPGVTYTVPKVGVDGPYAVGNALIYTLEGELVAVAVKPVVDTVSTESLEEEAPVVKTKPARPTKGTGARAQGCARGEKREGASF